MARAVLEPGRIADRVEKQAIALGEFGVLFQCRHEPCQRQRALRFIAVNGRENPDADHVPASLRPEKKIAWQLIRAAVALEIAARFPENMLRVFRKLV